MKISTKGRYALRLMIDLALNYNGTYIRIKDISKRQDISEKYLEQIIAVMHKSGFVKSARGAQGGYMLSKDPKEYSVGMILRAVEGSLAPVSCLDSGDVDCERKSQCATVILWTKLNDAINEVVDGVTLEDLVNWQKEMMESDYSI